MVDALSTQTLCPLLNTAGGRSHIWHQCYLGKQQQHMIGKAQILLINGCSSFFVPSVFNTKGLTSLNLAKLCGKFSWILQCKTSLISIIHAQKCFAIPPLQHYQSVLRSFRKGMIWVQLQFLLPIPTGVSGEEEQPLLIVYSRKIMDSLNSYACRVPSICPQRCCFLIRGNWYSLSLKKY